MSWGQGPITSNNGSPLRIWRLIYKVVVIAVILKWTISISKLPRKTCWLHWCRLNLAITCSHRLKLGAAKVATQHLFNTSAVEAHQCSPIDIELRNCMVR